MNTCIHSSIHTRVRYTFGVLCTRLWLTLAPSMHEQLTTALSALPLHFHEWCYTVISCAVTYEEVDSHKPRMPIACVWAYQHYSASAPLLPAWHLLSQHASFSSPPSFLVLAYVLERWRQQQHVGSQGAPWAVLASAVG